MVSRTKAKGRTARRAPPAKPAAAPVVAVAAETPPVEAPVEPAADAPETARVTPSEIDGTASNPAAEHEDAPKASTDTAAVALEADAAPADDAEAPDETIVEGFIGGGTLIPISHPDGGTIDGALQDADGNFLVRAIDAPIYFAHGFAVVDEQA